MTLLLMTAFAINPAAWLQEAAIAEKSQATLREPYVYRERQTNWNLKGDTDQRDEKPYVARVYEHIFLEGAPYRQVIEVDGKPLSGSELAKRDAARKKEAAKRRELRRLRKPFFPGTRHIRLGALDDLAAAYHLKEVGEQTVRGFPCVVIQAEPNGLTDTVKNKELQAYRQRLWLHRDLKVLVQRQADVIGPGSEVLPGSTLLFQWAPLPEGNGTWFPTEHEITFGAKVFGVKKVRSYQKHEYFDYRRFQVESTLTATEP